MLTRSPYERRGRQKSNIAVPEGQHLGPHTVDQRVADHCLDVLGERGQRHSLVAPILLCVGNMESSGVRNTEKAQPAQVNDRNHTCYSAWSGYLYLIVGRAGESPIQAEVLDRRPIERELLHLLLLLLWRLWSAKADRVSSSFARTD